MTGAILAVVFLAGCSMTSEATDFSGVTTPDGTASHVSTTNIAVHVLFTKPVLGDATLHRTVSDHTMAAKAAGARQVRIVQSRVCTYWWILPPISFVIQPVVTNVASDAIR
jgi:hypothetical protein